MDLLMFDEHTVPNDKKDGGFALAEGGGIPGGVDGRTSSLPAMEVDMVDYLIIICTVVSCACGLQGVEVSTF
jgi:hypothetical protein